MADAMADQIFAGLLTEQPRWRGWSLELESPFRLGFVASADGVLWFAYKGVRIVDGAVRLGEYPSEALAKGAVEDVFRARGWQIDSPTLGGL